MFAKEIFKSFFLKVSIVDQQDELGNLKTFYCPSLQKKKVTKKTVFQQNGASTRFLKAVHSW